MLKFSLYDLLTILLRAFINITLREFLIDHFDFEKVWILRICLDTAYSAETENLLLKLLMILYFFIKVVLKYSLYDLLTIALRAFINITLREFLIDHFDFEKVWILWICLDIAYSSETENLLLKVL